MNKCYLLQLGKNNGTKKKKKEMESNQSVVWTLQQDCG